MARIPYKKPLGKIAASLALIGMLGYAGADTALDYVEQWEGYVPVGYKDPVGIPTKCFGDTTDVILGKEYTWEECSRSLTKHLEETTRPITKCVKDWNEVPELVRASFASMAYNIGPYAFCKSSIVTRYWNKGKKERACERMSEIYTTAKGVKLRGLVRRRAFESEMCRRGLRGDGNAVVGR